MRQVNTTPPVAVEEQKAAKERAKRDAAEAKAADKVRDKERETRKRRPSAPPPKQKKAQAKQRERCDRAQRELERARSSRASLLQQRPATIEQMQKADGRLGKSRS